MTITVHGTQDLANVLTRSGVSFHYVTSPANDPQGLEELGDFFAAAAAVNRLRSARIGMIGYPFPGMGDFAVDTARMAATLGCSWTNLTVEDYNNRCGSVSASELGKLVAEYRRTYDLAADLTETDLNSTAAAEIAMRGMVADHRLSALTYQFTAFGDDDRTRTLPFVARSSRAACRSTKAASCCRRAIEPRRGYWTIPAGFMENGETTQDAARRESVEEALADGDIGSLLAVVHVLHADQVHVMFRARLARPEFGAGAESLEVTLCEEAEIPWKDLAFRSVDYALRRYVEDRRAGLERHHFTAIDLRPGVAR